MLLTKDIKQLFEFMYINQEFNDSGLLEILGASFIADKSSIFGLPNEEYIKKEIMWYNSKSRNVYDMHNPPQVWKDVATKDGRINSNYGWCIYSDENYQQYFNVLETLKKNPNSRQGIMIYTRPTMHSDSCIDGMKDFMCTNTVSYFIRNNKLNCVVQMRSNDIVYGYKNDYAWQLHVLQKLAKDLLVEVGDIYWQVSSLHMYPRHFKLLDSYTD